MTSISRRTALSLLAGGVGALTLPFAARANAALNIVTTTGMIADATRAVGGEHVSVASLMGAGIDPHTYRQTRSDIARMLKADGVLWHGLYLEAQLETFLLELAQRRPVTAVAEALPRERLIAHDEYADRLDPHVWMDPDLWAGVVEAVRAALTSLRPSLEQTFRANANRHLGELQQLQTYSRNALNSVPAEARILVTAHDAFRYFGRAYGFDVMGIQGISTESEAGLKRVEALVSTLVERRIKAIFVETSVADQDIRALIEGAAAKGWAVTIGGSLYSDAMGAPGTYEGTYLGMIDHNVTTITRALGGKAPERGFVGRLALAG